MSDTIATPAANDPLIDGLLVGAEWNVTLLTYGFPTTAAQYGGAGYAYDHDGNPGTSNANEATGMSQLSLDMRNAIIRAMNDLAAFTQMDVLQLPANSAGAATLRFAVTTTPRPNNAADPAYANFPNWTKAGDAWFDPGTFDTAPIGSYAYAVAIHELGHLLGLKHGHEGGGPGGTDLPADRDSTEFSIMTYASFIGDGADNTWNHGPASFPQSWMMLDIRALQHMYGADYTTNGGNTVYSFDDTDGTFSIDGVSQGTPSGNIIFRTIWDGFGVDTYDFSSYGSGRQMLIDLQAGGWTDVDSDSNFQAAFLGGGPNGGFARGQVFNALMVNGDTRSLIENAIGGAGNDSITGNQAGNWLEGRNGNDTLSGLAGNDLLEGGSGDDWLLGGLNEDTLRGGEGADDLDGGGGFDMASYLFAPSAVTVDLAWDRGDGTFGKVTGGDNGDTFLSIEDIEGSTFGDQLGGVAGQSNRILGHNGNDVIDGRGGIDIVDGGEGDDTVFAHGDDLQLRGGLGSFDSIASGGISAVFDFAANSFSVDGVGIVSVLEFEGAIGGIGNDRFVANFDNLAFRGGGGNDTLIGGNGDNVLEGGDGADQLTFGNGFDYADFRDDTVGVLVDIRSGISALGHAAGDSWIGTPEGLLGGGGNDSLGGSEIGNRLLARGGNDYASGYGGDDTVEGGDGNDSLEGGLGADWVFGDAGNDVLGDTEQVLLLSGAEDNAADTLFGGAGNDSLLAGGGADSLDGGTEDDLLVGGSGADNLVGGTGDDILTDHTQAPTFASESPPPESFIASDADTLLGGDGQDFIYASGGGDVIDGGAGIDNLLMSFTESTGPLVFTFAAAGPWTMTLGGVVTATIQGIESLNSITGTAQRDTMTATAASFGVVLDGGGENDILRGGAGADVLIGSGGKDRLFGNGGNDFLVGGAGPDTMAGGGGTGVDTFRWDVIGEGKDTILNFVSGQDRLWIDASGFRGGLVETMDLAAAGKFVLGNAPTAKGGQFLYDQPLGQLWWDVDGTNAKAALLLASFGANTTVAAGDFLIVA